MYLMFRIHTVTCFSEATKAEERVVDDEQRREREELEEKKENSKPLRAGPLQGTAPVLILR